MKGESLKKKRKVTYTSMHQTMLQLIISACLVFIIISIASGNTTDACLFLVYSSPTVISNWCGALGAQIFGLLFYLFGYAAFLYIPLHIWILFDIWYRKIWFHNFYYYLTSVIMIIIGSFLIQAHQISSFGTVFQPCIGGLCGYYMDHLLCAVCNRVGSLIVGYAGLILTLVAIIPYSSTDMLSRVIMVGKAIRLALSPGISFVQISIMYFFRSGRAVCRFVSKKRSGIIQESQDFTRKSVELADSESATAVHELGGDQTFTIPCAENLFECQASLHTNSFTSKEVQHLVHIIEEKLGHFGVRGAVTAIKQGPVVTLFEYQPTIDSKISKILALEDDLALALKAISIRIIAPIPGRSVIGLEVSNKKPKSVLFGPLIVSDAYTKFAGSLPLILGQDTVGNPVIIDLAKMPHLLVAGSTGSGKSVSLNSMIVSLLCTYAPATLRLILIDPKRLEFSLYTDIAHLLFPIVTHPRKSVPILRWVLHEMETRYQKMAELGVRNIVEYNNRAQAHTALSYIVIIIDEFADLMITAGKEVEDLITRIAQMARASGIHMIIATQRPSVDVITGTIKVNFPARISFRVTSKIDSRTILDVSGAQQLLGKGDMLFLNAQSSSIMRVHGAFVSDQEIARLVEYIKKEQTVTYQTLDISFDTQQIDEEDEQLLQQILEYLKTIDEVSISLLQRKFRIGYNRSARIIDILEQKGHVISCNSGKSRKVVH